MGKRGFTVGSLMPGRMTPKQALSPVPFNRDYHNLTKIIVEQNRKRFEIEPIAGTLLDVALNQGKTLQYKCRNGTCGKCTVKLVESGPGISAPNEKEHKKLKKRLNEGFRLACQAEILK